MRLPFTVEQFLGAFRAYNDAIGAAPVLLMAMAVALIVAAHASAAWRHRVVAIGLAILWLWAGIVYHWVFFSRINPAARLFAAAFVAQAILLVAFGVIRGRVLVSPRESGSALLGWLSVVYALVAYPVIGWVQGHGYPDGPSFGAPCPATIYFFGLMFWTTGRLPLLLVSIPLAWAVIGTSAAFQLGITEDYALGISALLLVVEMMRRRRAATAHGSNTSGVVIAGHRAG